ncbi:MAG: transcriptional regulator PpsR [Steroidobacteraceae bacterium]|nr:transcriptional regulator PpsR [Steroidobacteraceae bacterium]
MNTRFDSDEFGDRELPGRSDEGSKRHFNHPRVSLADIDPDAAARAIESASDVALVLDDQGIVRDMAFGSDDLSREGFTDWLGKPWGETVTVESRPKIAALLQNAANDAAPRRRQVNHPSPRGADIPILYSAVPLGRGGRIVAVGRDLRQVAVLQQRLIEAQQSMERDYWRLRLAETRYRVLFQMSGEAILILDAGSRKVLEVNPAACELLGEAANRLAGRSFPVGADADGTRSLQAMLDTLVSTGRTDDVRVRLAGDGRSLAVSASIFRQDDAAQVVVRMTSHGVEPAEGTRALRSRTLEFVARSPDALVITDKEGRILSANRAFLDMAQVAAEEMTRGEPLERWLGRPGVDVHVLSASLRRHGSVRLFSTTLRGEFGTVADVEVSAVDVPEGETPCMGFVIRNVGRRLAGERRPIPELPNSVEQLTELVGRVSLKDLVREATDVIERLCIEAALEVTNDNRASAAEMLGLSRQSLYTKLRRYGLGEGGAPESGR